MLSRLLAADADEAVAGGAHRTALEEHLDVVPVVEGVSNGGHPRVLSHTRMFSIVCVGEHHAPAEGVVGPVALDHRDVGGAGSRCFMSSAKYRPAGPPPMHRIMFSLL
jgi:hypothetical protein